MMGRLKAEQHRLFYEFHLGDLVPGEHLVRRSHAAPDLSRLRVKLKPFEQPRADF
jgi:hypothetical protein